MSPQLPVLMRVQLISMWVGRILRLMWQRLWAVTLTAVRQTRPSLMDDVMHRELLPLRLCGTDRPGETLLSVFT